jgi:hypothetical protein
MRWLVVFFVVMLSAVRPVGPARAEGPLEAFTLNEEASYSLLSTKTTDASGVTTRTVTQSAIGRSTFRLNYDVLPTLNLNAGVVAERNYAFLTGDVPDSDTELTRLTPYVWLTLRDPVYDVAVGWDRDKATVKALGTGRPETSLTRDTYTANLNWRPVDLPYTQLRYTRTSTRDDPRAVLDIDQDQVYLKTEYVYRGLDASYTGTYIDTRDSIQKAESQQFQHEGKLVYTGSFLDNRVSVVSDNRIRYTEFTSSGGIPAGAETALVFGLAATAGLSSLDDTPLDEPLAPNPALIDGDLTTSAGVNLGFPGPGGDFRRRNVGLDFGTAQAVNRLLVWVAGFGPDPLPADITSAFSWEIYTSTDNLNWALHATVPVATFGPFDQRFVLTFPPVTTRFVKAVTRPLSGGIIGSTNSSQFPTLFITELQAFSDSASPTANRVRITQTNRTHNFDLRVILFRFPSLYYRLNGIYQETDPGSLTQYVISNGLFFNHQLTPIFSVSANASFEFGKEHDLDRTAVLYYAALGATPLRTLTDSLVFSGNLQWEGPTTTTTNSVVLYNTAQLYRGIDATLNVGAVFTSNDEGGGSASERRDLYVNPGTTITPHPSLTLTAYYLGKLSHSSGANVASPADQTENRLDLSVSFTPFRTLFFTAAVNIDSLTGQQTTVQQNYGVNWAPFPDGSLQTSFFYSESHPTEGETTRIIQPTVRWYLTSRRRSYLEATYQFNKSESAGEKTEAHLFSGKLSFYLW